MSGHLSIEPCNFAYRNRLVRRLAAEAIVRRRAALAGAARPGWAGRKEVVGADRPPRVRRFGVGGEDQEFIVAVDANPGDHDRPGRPGPSSRCQQQPRRRA